MTKQDVFEVINNVVNNAVGPAVDNAVCNTVNKIVNDAIEKNNADLLENINDLFSGIEQRITSIEQKMVTKDELKSELAKFETRMITKEFFTDTLDDRLLRLRRGLSEDTKKNERCLTATVNLLSKKKIFSQSEAATVLAS